MKHGSILIYSLLIMSVILAISLSLNAAFLRTLGNIREARDSVQALYAADGGVEYCLYEARTGNVATGFYDYVERDEDTCAADIANQNQGRQDADLAGGTNEIMSLPNLDRATQGQDECTYTIGSQAGEEAPSFKITDLVGERTVGDCTQFLNAAEFRIRTTGSFRSANRSLEISF